MLRLATKPLRRLVLERAACAFAESAGAGLGQVLAAWVQSKVFPEDLAELAPVPAELGPAAPDEEE